MATHDFFVSIDGARGAEWEAVTGTRRFPVRSPVPVLAHLPGYAVPQPVYLLALDQIDAETRARIVAHLASKFGLSEAEVAVEIAQAGIPILEDQCSVVVHHPMRWF